MEVERIWNAQARIHGDWRRRARGIGWEFLHVAIDDHSRVSRAGERRIRPGYLRQGSRLVRSEEIGQHGEKGGERLPRAGGGGDEDMFPAMNGGDRGGLGWRERAKRITHPRTDRGSEHAERAAHRGSGSGTPLRRTHESPASSRTRCSVSISAAGLSSRTRTMRGNRSA